MNSLLRRALRYGALLPVMFLCGACSSTAKHDALHQFKLVGGHFYGPGPIVPDTALPTGYLRNIHFDVESFSGYANFLNDGGEDAVLSDGKTRINQNIDAGILEIGGGDNTVLLVAVKGGPNRGLEYYQLTDDYVFEWEVDLALDPGFAEGIVRVDQFKLTTGLIKIADSLQTERGIPNGYDQAGTLKSGDYLAGRVGDFNQDGYLDGIVVAAPRVPLESQMLPGSPVGNQRGFETDVAFPPHLACELTLRGILQFEAPIAELMASGEVEQVVAMLKDIAVRIESAQGNMDRALISGAWGVKSLKQDGFLVSDRMETLRTLNFISLSLIEHYPIYGGKFSSATTDAVGKMFDQVHSLIHKIGKVNKQTSHRLPKRRQRIRS